MVLRVKPGQLRALRWANGVPLFVCMVMKFSIHACCSGVNTGVGVPPELYWEAIGWGGEAVEPGGISSSKVLALRVALCLRLCEGQSGYNGRPRRLCEGPSGYSERPYRVEGEQTDSQSSRSHQLHR